TQHSAPSTPGSPLRTQDSGLGTQNSALRTVLVIAGPTGVGKSELAVRVASAIGGEIVNFDSVQIYRGFDIGSAKPSLETRGVVPHHLYDIIDADVEFNAADYARLARTTCDEIVARGRRPILVGGTFFYLRALLSGLPEMPPRDENVRARIRNIAARPNGQARLHRWLARVDPASGRAIAPMDRHRVERALEVWLTSGLAISSWERPAPVAGGVRIALQLERKQLVDILDRRVDAMFRSGLIEETRALLERYSPDARPFGTIGYREAAAVVQGTMTAEAAIAETRRRTRAYAKRQMTWLRAEPGMHWIDGKDREHAFEAAMRLIEALI
ncbi:MAG TPA: tRNA (adenosine(37)-N6)-dimethylallyltransferase MiaA, partial [Thermoanaerobaculia bacterium]|nr:tRNA (adenosine(37)-N6)-dimethylallyltransferase MiaA [Thermoanaerobaculia bacterium]